MVDPTHRSHPMCVQRKLNIKREMSYRNEARPPKVSRRKRAEVQEICQKRPLCMHQRRLAGSLKLQVSFAKEPYKRDDILQKRPIILRSLRMHHRNQENKARDLKKSAAAHFLGYQNVSKEKCGSQKRPIYI